MQAALPLYLLLAVLAARKAGVEATAYNYQRHLGRATYYGNGDGYTLNDGSCACHKQWGWFTNACEGSFCFDYIGSPPPADGQGFAAAINTAGTANTDQCGTCYNVQCTDGPTRGTPGAEFQESGCWTQNRTITVMITDSCPCQHRNPSNQKWCCGDKTHFDLSYWAFKELADPNAGVIDLMYERLPFCPKGDLGVRTPTCDEYNGLFPVTLLWKLGAGVGASLSVAAVFAGLLVAALYGRREPCMLYA